MKKWIVVTAVTLMSWAGKAQAISQGQLGLTYSVGPSFILGGSDARDAGVVEPGVGAALHYGLLPNIEAIFSYDYIDADLRSQALTFGAEYRLPHTTAVTPFVGAGLGFGKPYSGEDWGHFSIKLTGGMEKSLTETISIAAVVNYQYIEGPDPIGSVHSFWPGLRLSYAFGSFTPTATRTRTH